MKNPHSDSGQVNLDARSEEVILLPPDPPTSFGNGDAILDSNVATDPGKAKRILAWFGRHPRYRRVAITGSVILVLVAISGGAVMGHYHQRASAFDLSEMSKIEAGSLAVDRNGERIGRISLQDRRLVALDEVPQHLVDALVATEDSRFFAHPGFDLRGIGRAAVANIKSRRISQGGSTITQQLARHAFSLGGRNFDRKFTELFLAIRIEKDYSKEEILEHYLNRIYLGCGYWGVGSASLGYFGKEVSELEPDESAMLCAIIKSPNRFSPFVNTEAAVSARDRTLTRMLSLELIDRPTCKSLKSEPCKALDSENRNGRPQYLLAQLRSEALEILGRQRTVDGYSIETGVDIRVQEKLTAAIEQSLRALESQPGYEHQTMADFRALDENGKSAPDYLQAAAVVVENRTGRIVSAVGGRDFSESQFNRVFQSRRPAGSAFFPLVYAAAFESAAVQAMSKMNDTPMDNRKVMVGGTKGVLGEWAAEDTEVRYQGEVTAGYGLATSRNGIAVEVGNRVGVDEVKAIAERTGIESPLRDYPSTFVGVSEMNLLELVSAYTVFPNLGKRVGKPRLISRILAPDGEVVYDASSRREVDQWALTDNTAATINGLLQANFTMGPAREAEGFLASLDGEVAGKTGTSYNFEDNWFIGYNSDFTWGVWIGFDNPRPIGLPSFSRNTAMPVWLSVARMLDTGKPFSDPEGWESESFCLLSGAPAGAGCIHVGGKDLTVDLPVPTVSASGDLHRCSMHAEPSAIDGDDSPPPRGSSYTSILNRGVVPIRPKVSIVTGDDIYGVLPSSADSN